MARILIVDDDADVRFIMEHVLADAGHKVEVAGTASRGRELLQSSPYDLVIADGKLPDGTGMDVADAADGKGTKALIITGYAFTLPVEMQRHYEILLKPLRPIEILRAVEQTLAGPNQLPCGSALP